MSLVVESSYRWLYLREGDVQVYVGYDLDGLNALMATQPPEHVIFHFDPAGNRHMLVISPQLSAMKKPQKKFKLGFELLTRYGKMQYARNPFIRLMQVDHLVGHLFDEVNHPKPNEE